MKRPVATHMAMVGLALLALLAAQPRLTIALEHAGDLNPRRMALTGKIMGRALGLVISWSGQGRQQIR
ncbi:MAG: hypothetical protein MUE77_08940 [Sandarakinorhabdus sp.]|nr:hypothetical protein [Sandarakinorhabdus sp.]